MLDAVCSVIILVIVLVMVLEPGLSPNQLALLFPAPTSSML